jgi:apolipoprotein N-acyltransferase
MAVFRSVENYRSMVRSTASGQTCAINPTGKVVTISPPFTEAWNNTKVPIVKKTSFYTLYGDFLAIIFTIITTILLIFGSVSYIIRKTTGDKGK